MLGTRVPTAKRASQEGFSELRKDLENYKDENNKLQAASMHVMKRNMIKIVVLGIIVVATIALAIMSPWMWSKATDGGLDRLPLGTILPWVPRIGKSHKSAIPIGWLPCNGTRITQGPWENGFTPDLNTAQRFLRGGSEDEALQTQADQIHQHGHRCTATSLSSPHTHSYERAHNDGDDAGKNTDICGTDKGECADKDTLAYRKKESEESTVPVNTHCVVGDTPSSARAGAETRPVNMKVVFIVKCW